MITNAWWTEVSGPSRFIAAVADAASAQKSTVLSVPAEMPFKADFIRVLTESLQREFSGHSVTYISSAEGSAPGYFMRKCCKREARAAFRPKPGYTEAHFLAETEKATMHGGCFIVDVRDPKDLADWTSFISAYLGAVKGDIMPAVFAVLCRGEKNVRQVKGLKSIRYADFTSQFDTYAYCAIRASQINERNEIKTYLADLAASITGGNAEHAETALYVYREFLDDPIRFMINHFPGETYDADALGRLVWESQLKCIFPLLERYRCRFVEKYSDGIERFLPLENPLGDDYTVASDVELGSLLYLSRNGLMIDTEDYVRLKKMSAARNDLAHLTVLSIDAVREILGDV